MAGNPLTPSPRGDVTTYLCRLEEIGDGGKEVAMGERDSLFLIRREASVYAYVNACPHTGAPLNWGRDQFLNRDGSLIQCSFHGALFRIDDGLCVWGPCVRQHLRSVPVGVRDGAVILDNAAGD
jgi:nitrite reductase/ring-hydroxylating ferredoxin subunit